MFAGPNGSGKTTIKSVLPARILGVYLNPDEIEETIREHGAFDLTDVGGEADEARTFLIASPFLQRAGLRSADEALRAIRAVLYFSDSPAGAYMASALADFLRRRLISAGLSFTFETMMSSSDKIAFLEQARREGYRTYLYYVATGHPLINVLRIPNRVALGEPPALEVTIRSYYWSLDLLSAVVAASRLRLPRRRCRNAPRVAVIELGADLRIEFDQGPGWLRRAEAERRAHLKGADRKNP